ncbi:MAG TPA: hypothetical protein VLU25_06090 [Acidobacteriota bacterium]|nr:hypothetical protein [Acidobacteriota bacterium]
MQDRDRILEDFRRLCNLLKSQQEALGQGDAQKLASLLPLIEDYTRRVCGHASSPPSLNLPDKTRRQLRGLRRQILDLAQGNAESYRKRREGLQAAQRQLQSGARYLRQFQSSSPRPPSGSRLELSG